jgi:hypothetical protein
MKCEMTVTVVTVSEYGLPDQNAGQKYTVEVNKPPAGGVLNQCDLVAKGHTWFECFKTNLKIRWAEDGYSVTVKMKMTKVSKTDRRLASCAKTEAT